MREGSQLLVRAFEGDPDNPYVLVLLAHFCLQQGFHDKVPARLPTWLPAPCAVALFPGSGALSCFVTLVLYVRWRWCSTTLVVGCAVLG